MTSRDLRVHSIRSLFGGSHCGLSQLSQLPGPGSSITCSAALLTSQVFPLNEGSCIDHKRETVSVCVCVCVRERESEREREREQESISEPPNQSFDDID